MVQTIVFVVNKKNSEIDADWLRRDIANIEHLRDVSASCFRDKQVEHGNALITVERRRQADQERQGCCQITISVRSKLNELRKARIALHCERFELAQEISKHTHSQPCETVCM